jgi:hypothetical protein
VIVRLLLLAALAIPASASAQARPAADITGLWRVDTGADVGNGPREVIIRADSSASWGKEIVRWRLKGDQIAIAIGGEWERYKVKVNAKSLTLSGGDLRKPVTLKRIGEATPRAPNVKIPDDPDA